MTSWASSPVFPLNLHAGRVVDGGVDPVRAGRWTMSETTAARPLDEPLLHAATRPADHPLRHLSDQKRLVDDLVSVEHARPPGFLDAIGLREVA